MSGKAPTKLLTYQFHQLTVITGQPITFSSDLADSKTPSRKHVNIVQESAVGAVKIDSPFNTPVMSDMASGTSKKLARQHVDAKKKKPEHTFIIDTNAELAAAPNVYRALAVGSSEPVGIKWQPFGGEEFATANIAVRIAKFNIDV